MSSVSTGGRHVSKRQSPAARFIAANNIDTDPRNPAGERHTEFLKAVFAVAALPVGTADSAIGLLREGCGTPRAKHLLLAETFRAMQLPYRHALSTFYWPEQQLKLPTALQTACQLSLWPQPHHTLEVQTVLGNTVHVDVSWNPALAKHGFHSIDADWDGFQHFYAMRKRSIAWVGNTGWSQAADQLFEQMPERSRVASIIFNRLLIDWLATQTPEINASKANLM